MSSDAKPLLQSEGTANGDGADNSMKSIFDLDNATSFESSDLNQIIEQLGLSIEASKQQSLALLTTTANNLINAISKHWLTSCEGWLSLSDLLNEIRQRLKKQNASLLSVAQRFRESGQSLRSSDSSESHASDRDTPTSAALNIANQIRSLNFRQQSTHSQVKYFCVERSCSSVVRRVEHAIESPTRSFKLWAHTLANDLEICVNADGLVRDDRTPFTGSYGGARNAVQKEIDRHLMELVAVRFKQGLRAGVLTATATLSERAFDSTKTIDRFVDNDSLSRWIELSIDFLATASKDIGVELAITSKIQMMP